MSDDGTTAVIGAVKDEDPHGDEGGSAYVFEAGDGAWNQGAKLTPDDGESEDWFGHAVGLSSDGTTALISAPYDENSNGRQAGSAYVFEASDGAWNQQTKLTPDDGDSEDWFSGSALSDDGTTAIVGAVGDEDPSGKQAGSAYVFEATDGAWSQQAKLTPDDGDSGDQFGYPVAVSSDGTTALIGAKGDDDPNGKNAGSAYVFERSGDSWSQAAKLLPDDGDSEDEFGWSVGLSSDGTTALIGAHFNEDPNGRQAGSAYVFDAGDGSWNQRAKLVPERGDGFDGFGWSAALSKDGTTALVSAIDFAMDPNDIGAGSAYVFEASDGSWSQQVKLSPDDGESKDWFGHSVGLSGDGGTALVGARSDDNSNGENAGSAYVFEL